MTNVSRRKSRMYVGDMKYSLPEDSNSPSSSLPAHPPCDLATWRSVESTFDPDTRQSIESSADPSVRASVEPAVDHSAGSSIEPLVEVPAPYEALSDGELHATVRRLTAHSNIALADLLVHLGEVERRGIHRERACASLYTYLVYELRMSEDAAYRRAKAARIVREHPDLRDVIARGELHLTGLLMVAPYLGGERHAEVLARARFRTKREISRVVAELDPKAPVAPRIVPLAPALPRRARNLQEALAGYYRNLPEGDRPADWVESADAAGMSRCDVGEHVRASCDTGDADLSAAEEALAGAWDVGRSAPPDRPLNY
jgi:hypothetical protein